MTKQALQIVLARPRGFCAGVVRAVDIVERALQIYGAPVYVRHEIVHNKYVVENLRDKGARFVEEIEQIPQGAVTVFSAHGVSLKVKDDTREIIAALKARFPAIRGPNVKDICYATQNRQTAARLLADRADVILVIGADNSSNSNRLREIGEETGTDAYLIPDADELNPVWLDGARTVGITAGASAPEVLVQDLIRRLGEMFDVTVTNLDGIEENVAFKLPRVLLDAGERTA